MDVGNCRSEFYILAVCSLQAIVALEELNGVLEYDNRQFNNQRVQKQMKREFMLRST